MRSTADTRLTVEMTCLLLELVKNFQEESGPDRRHRDGYGSVFANDTILVTARSFYHLVPAQVAVHDLAPIEKWVLMQLPAGRRFRPG